MTSDGKVVLATADPSSNTTVVSVIDSQTGDFVGTGPEVVTGWPDSNPLIDEANHRIYVSSYDYDTKKTTVSFVSTDTGEVFGTPVEMDGYAVRSRRYCAAAMPTTSPPLTMKTARRRLG